MLTLSLENNIVEGDHPELEHVEMTSAQPQRSYEKKTSRPSSSTITCAKSHQIGTERISMTLDSATSNADLACERAGRASRIVS
jgi:hypothetical protein